MSSATEEPRVVFDCMIFLQATASESGPSFQCLRKVETDELCLFVSQEILDEVRAVLLRPKVQRKLPLLTPERVDALLKRLRMKAILATDIPQVFQYERDPKDEKYVNLALAVNAQYLVSRDLDLLALMDDTLLAGKDFRERFPYLRILNPVAFLREIAWKGA